MKGVKSPTSRLDHKSWIFSYLMLFFLEIFLVCINISMKQKSNIPNTFYVTKHLTTQFRAAKEIFSFFFLSFFLYLFYLFFIYLFFPFTIYAQGVY